MGRSRIIQGLVRPVRGQLGEWHGDESDRKLEAWSRGGEVEAEGSLEGRHKADIN